MPLPSDLKFLAVAPDVSQLPFLYLVHGNPVTKFYDNAHAQYFTVINPDDGRLSVVMRRVPYSISDEEVKTELVAIEKLILDIISPLIPKIQTFSTQTISNLVTGLNPN